MEESYDLNLGCLRIFYPGESDWRVYKDQLNQYFIINRINEDEIKRGLLLNMCSETAYQLISTLCLPAKPETQDYEALVAVLDKYFTPPKLIFHERQTYYEAKKNNKESVIEWAARVKQLAGNCGFSSNELDAVLRDRFVCGLPKGPIKDRIYEEMPEDLTFERAVEIARSKEASCKLDEIANLWELPTEQYERRRSRRWNNDTIVRMRLCLPLRTTRRQERANLQFANPFPYPTCSAELPEFII